MGLYNGLGIQPNLHLTKIQDGYYIRYTRYVRCPCLFACATCTDIHERDEILFIFLDDITNFLQLIRGKAYAFH